MSSPIPWNIERIENLAADTPRAVVGGPFGSDLVSSDYVTSGVPVIRGTNLPFGKRFSLENLAFVSERKADQLSPNTARPNDIVFTQRGTLGQVGIVPQDAGHDRFIVSQSQMKLTVDPTKADPVYLFYYFTLPSTVRYIENHALQSGVPHINLGILKRFEVPLPDLAIQQKIAAILTAYDDMLENNRQRIALLEKMAEEIYREWFVRLRFPGHEHTPVHKGVPEGWDLKHLPDCITVKPPEAIDPQDERPFVGMDRLSTSSAFFNAEERRIGASGPRFRNGDTLLPRITPCLENGKRGFVMCLEDDEVASGSTEFIVLRGKTLPPEFVYCLSVSDGFRKHCENSMVGASGRQRVHEGCLNWILIKHPPPEIAKKFSEITSPMYRQAKCLLDQNAKLEQTRDLLLNRLISGKLRVDDLDIQFPPSMQDEAA